MNTQFKVPDQARWNWQASHAPPVKAAARAMLPS
jgi:hypothetical protein